ncbi:response regulator transcription factor [Vallitalea maricola]|uniref:Two-component system response regulator DegU n=1 Tax=Vallitalea maricola TaxID=3074433 RepID=A0ACB5UQS2_9FIRM|nr:two-component system response regulator DegU [Vallitalea sp. AN17-2]
MSEIIRCMIAEDYKTLNDIFKNLINYEHDMEVIGTAFSGKDIYEMVIKREPDIILMDIEMETKSAGIEYSKKILEKFPNIKIIILTCYEDEEVIISAYEVGVVDYLLKNNSSSIILESIRAAYNNQSPIRPYAANAIRKTMLSLGTYKNNLLTVTNIIATLTSSEMDILKLLLFGKKQREIADVRSVELSTVKYHVSSILRKFKCKRTQEVIQIVKEIGIENILDKLTF